MHWPSHTPHHLLLFVHVPAAGADINANTDNPLTANLMPIVDADDLLSTDLTE